MYHSWLVLGASVLIAAAEESVKDLKLASLTGTHI